MNDLTVYNFNGSNVRVIIRDDEPWFVAKDVCGVLELEKTDSAIRELEPDEKGTHVVSTLGGNQRMSVVSESGLYALIFKSRKPEAKVFRKWVTSEVLPAIRKTGRYVNQATVLSGDKGLSLPRMAREYRAFKSMAITSGLRGNPAVISADGSMRRLYNVSPLQLMRIELVSEDNERICTPTELAASLALDSRQPGRAVNEALEKAGLQVRDENGCWQPTEKGRQYAVLVDTGKRHSGGTMVQQLKWKNSVVLVIKQAAQA